MISKEVFLSTIEKLKVYTDKVNKVDIALQTFGDCNGLFTPEVDDIVFRLLEEIFNDKSDYWITYFYYECNYMEECHPVTIEIDNKPIVISSWDEVYDFLISEMEN